MGEKFAEIVMQIDRQELSQLSALRRSDIAGGVAAAEADILAQALAEYPASLEKRKMAMLKRGLALRNRLASEAFA